MTKRISKRVREEAALICAVAASNNIGIFEVPFYIRAGEHAFSLAFAARRHALFNSMAELGHPVRAEAECLLRTGWSPGKEGW